jgi:hypothetical protein
MASSTNRITSCTSLSRGSQIVKGLLPPLALSIIILLPGEKEKDSDFNSVIRLEINSEDMPSHLLALSVSYETNATATTSLVSAPVLTELQFVFILSFGTIASLVCECGFARQQFNEQMHKSK